MTRPCALLGTAALVGLLATPAQATPILGQTLIATVGDVLPSSVSNGYMSDLFVDVPISDDLSAISSDWASTPAKTANLFSSAEGGDFIFQLLVQQKDDLVYTGPAIQTAGNTSHNGISVPDLPPPSASLPGTQDVLPVTSGGAVGGETVGGAAVSGETVGGAAVGGEPGGGVAGGGEVVEGGTVGGGPLGDETAAVPASGGPGAALTVDEPSNLVLLGSGLLMLVFVMRRQSVRR